MIMGNNNNIPIDRKRVSSFKSYRSFPSARIYNIFYTPPECDIKTCDIINNNNMTFVRYLDTIRCARVKIKPGKCDYIIRSDVRARRRTSYTTTTTETVSLHRLGNVITPSSRPTAYARSIARFGTRSALRFGPSRGVRRSGRPSNAIKKKKKNNKYPMPKRTRATSTRRPAPENCFRGTIIF